MSRNYTAYQYESSYRPKALRNWEVPNFFCDQPIQRYGKTKIIANTRGHILPGIVRPQCNPWGDFVGTWSMPKYISRQVADELNRTVSGREKLKSCKARLISKKLPKPMGVDTKEHQENVEAETTSAAPGDPKKEEKDELPKELHITEENREEVEKKIMCPIHDLYK